MARRPRRNHSPAFKAKVAVAAIKGEKTMIELSQEFDVHANQIKQWRDQLLEGATGVFGDGRRVSFIIERRLTWENPGWNLAPSEGAVYDLLDPEGWTCHAFVPPQVLV
jgi:transposase